MLWWAAHSQTCVSKLALLAIKQHPHQIGHKADTRWSFLLCNGLRAHLAWKCWEYLSHIHVCLSPVLYFSERKPLTNSKFSKHNVRCLQTQNAALGWAVRKVLANRVRNFSQTDTVRKSNSPWGLINIKGQRYVEYSTGPYGGIFQPIFVLVQCTNNQWEWVSLIAAYTL